MRARLIIAKNIARVNKIEPFTPFKLIPAEPDGYYKPYNRFIQEGFSRILSNKNHTG